MIAEVQLWGRTIGAVSLDEGREVAAFQYDAAFAAEAKLSDEWRERIQETHRLELAAK